METSDSEYFESADEGSQSDDDTVNSVKQIRSYSKKEESVASDVSCKLEKLELENLPVKSDSNEITEKTNIVSLHISTETPENSNISSNTITKESKPVNSKHCNKPQKGENSYKNYCQPKKIEDIEVEPTKFQICVSKTDSSTVQASSKNLEGHCKETSSIEKSITNPENKIIIKSEEQDENLWDDNEIDWNQETEEPKTIQNIEKKIETGLRKKSNKDEEHQKNVKDNDENLWDDDEIDWESEGKLDQQGKPLKESIKQNLEEDNFWKNDDWEPIEKPNEIIENKPEIEENSVWGGWNTWGVTSLLSTASQGVSTFTSHVSHGLSTVIEGGMGIPDPEQMAREDTSSGKDLESQIEHPPQIFGLGNLVGSVSHITKFVESTGSKVITGGLDTLETIGKKTMEVLQEGDPGLKKKRAFLKIDTGKPVLSQVLREAKEKAEKENTAEEEHIVKSKKIKSYETLFDDYQGLVHLEALEMLSKLSNMKLQSFNDSLSGESLKEMQETMDQVKELCELPEEEEDQQLSLTEIKERIDAAVEDLNIPVSYEKLLSTLDETDCWINNVSSNLVNEVDLHQEAIESLAKTTALAVEQFHKIGELLLVKEHRSTADEADSLVQLTTVVKSLILRQAGTFTDKLSSIQTSDKHKSNELITNIFYEAANSSSYIQDAFQLLIPVLQVGAV